VEVDRKGKLPGHRSSARKAVDGKSSPRPSSEPERLGMLVKRAEQAMVRTKSTALKSVGLTPSQYVALFELDRQPGITAATLARACLVTPQAMMILLKTMEQQGLITRSPHPRHPSVLELHMTEVGREALHAALHRGVPGGMTAWECAESAISSCRYRRSAAIPRSSGLAPRQWS
jgi:DNA-binding MarR family transcriptional regulator